VTKYLGWRKKPMHIRFLLILLLLLLTSCSSVESNYRTQKMSVTAYCNCGKCCDWQRGSDEWLHLDFWHKVINAGSQAGQPYTGETSSGTMPHQYKPGLFSEDTLHRPWMAPIRLICPWLWVEEDGTLAADIRYYPYGTHMYVPGYGWGVVEDTGGAIKGPGKLDVYYTWHSRTEEWGRQNLEVFIEEPASKTSENMPR
jgi:hypothetical protein